jgi:type VI protein secretion system component VasF
MKKTHDVSDSTPIVNQCETTASKQHDADHAKNPYAVSGGSPPDGTIPSAPASTTLANNHKPAPQPTAEEQSEELRQELVTDIINKALSKRKYRALSRKQITYAVVEAVDYWINYGDNEDWEGHAEVLWADIDACEFALRNLYLPWELRAAILKSVEEAHKAGQHLPTSIIWQDVGSWSWMEGFRTGRAEAKEDPKSAADQREDLQKWPTLVAKVASGETLIERLVNTIAQPKYDNLTPTDVAKAIGKAMWDEGFIDGVKQHLRDETALGGVQ